MKIPVCLKKGVQLESAEVPLVDLGTKFILVWIPRIFYVHVTRTLILTLNIPEKPIDSQLASLEDGYTNYP